METKRKCPSCGREIEEQYQFCPFDGTPLSRKCPACGKSWELSFQFCPADSTPLTAEAAPAPAAAPPLRQRLSPTGTAYDLRPTTFTFPEQVARPPWKEILMRPLTIMFTAGVAIVLSTVWYLHWRTSGPSLPTPVVSYTLQPNEGKTKGVPVAIKVNQLVVFLIDDPVEAGEGAGRAKQLVAALRETLRPLTTNANVRFAVDTADGKPEIVEIMGAGGRKKTIVTVSPDDATLAGETDPARLAALWAERLTDAVKLFVFGEAPSFSTRSEFGQTLLSLHKAAVTMDSRGLVTKKALDTAFARLTPAQRLALETPVKIQP